MKNTHFKAFELISQRFPQIAMPPEFRDFLESQEATNHQLLRIDSGETLLAFFIRQGVTPNELSAFLDEDSRIRSQIDYSALIEKTSDEIFSFFLDNYKNIFYLQDVALDSEFHTGFNRHGVVHIRSIASSASQIINSIISLNKRTLFENETIIGSFLHDIGNIISRKYHGFYGIYLLSQMFNNIDSNSLVLESFLNVMEILLFHEVEYGSQLSDLSILHPPALAVIIADKSDVNYKRVSPKSNLPEAIQDAHVLINLLVSESNIQRIKGINGRFQWTINFQPKLDDPQIDLFSSLLKATGRVKYPSDWKKLYEDSNIEYLFVFNSTFLKIYLSRLYFMMRAVFALYPSVDQFELIIEDAERGISLKRIFAPDDYINKVLQLGKHFFKTEWEKSYLYKALEHQSH